MRALLAAVLMGHGIAHLVGFAVSWQLMTSAEVPYRTTVLGGLVDVGPIGARVMGVVWLAIALTFVVVAAGVFLQVPWLAPVALAAVAASTMLCVLGWPDARFGLAANIVIALLLVVHARGAVLP